MTLQSSHRVLAPFPSNDGYKPSLPVPRRTKQSSACTACKARKSKCGGTQPCGKCVEVGSNCVFAAGFDRRRKFAQRHAEQELKITQQHLDNIIKTFNAGDNILLACLVSTAEEYRSGQAFEHTEHVSDAEKAKSQQQILKEDMGSDVARDRLAAEDESIPGLPDNMNRSATVFSPSSSTSVGSLNKVNIMTGHLNGNESSREKEYTDQESESAWVQNMNDQTPEPISVELRLLPHKSRAAHLLDVFLESVEPSFPLINKSLFIPQFDHAFTCSEPKPSRKWLAVLNLILAIGSKYCQLAEPVSGKDADDRVFLSRAIALSKSHGLATGHTDLQQVQIDLLLAIYYLAAGQVNRSWQISGRAALSATSMGLNLRVVGDQVDPVSKEMGTRIWWSIFCLEHLLSGMTGYTPCVDYRSVSANPPLPYDESHFRLPGVEELLRNDASREKRPQWTVHTSNMELQSRNQWFRTISPSGSLYFFHLVDLSITTHAAVNAVYSPTVTKDRRLSKISFYQEKLETWLSGLQKPFACTTDNYNLGKKKIVASVCREQVSLSLAYYSSQIILSRPCLTRPDKAGINSKAPRSRFEDDIAKSCVHFALTLISVLPNEPNTEWIFKMTPWWCILHFIRQALTVLLIQLSIDPVPVTTAYGEQSSEATEGEGAGVVFDASKKALRWLHSLAKQDPSSRRAFQISSGFLRCVTSAEGLDIKDMSLGPSQAEQASSKLQGSGDLGPRSLKLRDDALNWGRDCTVSDMGYEQQQAPFFLDPTLFSFDRFDF